MCLVCECGQCVLQPMCLGCGSSLFTLFEAGGLCSSPLHMPAQLAYKLPWTFHLSFLHPLRRTGTLYPLPSSQENRNTTLAFPWVLGICPQSSHLHSRATTLQPEPSLRPWNLKLYKALMMLNIFQLWSPSGLGFLDQGCQLYIFQILNLIFFRELNFITQRLTNHMRTWFRLPIPTVSAGKTDEFTLTLQMKDSTMFSRTSRLTKWVTWWTLEQKDLVGQLQVAR